MLEIKERGRKMKINNIEIKAKMFAFEGCHKFYLIEDEQDRKKATDLGYKVFHISHLQDFWDNCDCELKFISTWKLDTIVPQFTKAKFEE